VHEEAAFLIRPTAYSSKFTIEYWESANQNTLAVTLIENKTALDNIDDILNVPGIDFVFFGGRDYSMSCGYSHVNNPATNSAREILMKKCEKYNVPLAHFLFSPI